MLMERIAEFADRNSYPQRDVHTMPSETGVHTCLATGETGAPTLRIQPVLLKDLTWAKTIKAQPSGSKISTADTSFHAAHFFGRSQGDVGPMSESFGTRTAAGQTLLMRSDSQNKVCDGKHWLVMWTARATEAERTLMSLVTGRGHLKKEERIRLWNEVIRADHSPWESDMDVPAYLLYAKNRIGRCAALAYQETTVREVIDRIRDWSSVKDTRSSEVLTFSTKRSWRFQPNMPQDFVFGRTSRLEQIRLQKDPEMYALPLDRTNTDPNYNAGRCVAIVDFACALIDPDYLTIEQRFKPLITQVDIDFAINNAWRLFRRLGKVPFRALPKILEKGMPTPSEAIDPTPQALTRLWVGYNHQKQFLSRLRFGKCQVTERGDVVQSVGERIVANTLHAMGLQYIYEMPIRVEGDSARYRLPDFTVELPGGSFLIEFLGTAHSRESDPQWDRKLASYQQAGYDVAIIDDRDGNLPATEIARLTREAVLTRTSSCSSKQA